MPRSILPLGLFQECNQCVRDVETVVCCASCGFDTCPDCMVDDKCDDCDEFSEGKPTPHDEGKPDA